MDLDIEQLPSLNWLVNFVPDERFQIGIADILLLVGQIFEALEDFLKFIVLQMKAQLFQLTLQRMATAVLAQDQFALV